MYIYEEMFWKKRTEKYNVEFFDEMISYLLSIIRFLDVVVLLLKRSMIYSFYSRH